MTCICMFMNKGPIPNSAFPKVTASPIFSPSLWDGFALLCRAFVRHELGHQEGHAAFDKFQPRRIRPAQAAAIYDQRPASVSMPRIQLPDSPCDQINQHMAVRHLFQRSLDQGSIHELRVSLARMEMLALSARQMGQFALAWRVASTKSHSAALGTRAVTSKWICVKVHPLEIYSI